MLTRERMDLAKNLRRGLRHWGGQDPLAAAETVRQRVVGEGACLPMVRFCGGMVVPVVVWDLAALKQRTNDGHGPVLYREVLADRLAHDRDRLVPAVLRMRAFIAIHELAIARTSLGAISGYAAPIAAVPKPPGAKTWDVFEFDYQGFTVAEVDGNQVEVIVEGLNAGRHPLGGTPHQRRLMEEQLFDVALETGTLPAF